MWCTLWKDNVVESIRVEGVNQYISMEACTAQRQHQRLIQAVLHCMGSVFESRLWELSATGSWRSECSPGQWWIVMSMICCYQVMQGRPIVLRSGVLGSAIVLLQGERSKTQFEPVSFLFLSEVQGQWLSMSTFWDQCCHYPSQPFLLLFCVRCCYTFLWEYSSEHFPLEVSFLCWCSM